MDEQPDYYELLEITRDATVDQIKKAWRKKCKQHHTDREGGNNDEMVKFNVAYETLADPARREHYDKTGRNDYDVFIIAAHNTIVGLAMQWLQNFANEGDMIQWVQVQLMQQRSNIVNNKSNGQNVINRLNKALTKLHYKGTGKNLIAEMIKTQLDGITQQLKAADIQTAQIEVALKLVQSYEYDADIFSTPTMRVFLGPHVFNR